MTYQRFEDVPVWQKAAGLYEATEDLLESDAFKATRGFRDQLDRAALSVSNNIAEGFERGTTNELLAFIYIARGSAGEVRSMLVLKSRRAEKAKWPAELESRIANLISLAESCSRQLRGWADSLQNSDIKGQRHLNDKTRQEDDEKTRREIQPGKPAAASAQSSAAQGAKGSAGKSEISNLRFQIQPTMSEIQQNTLYLLTPASYVNRDHLTLQVEVPVYADDLPPDQRNRQSAIEIRKLSIPIHHLESICVFGPSTVSPPALDLCWEHGVAVNFLSDYGHLQARLTGVFDTSVTLRRTQFRAADDAAKCAGISRQIVAGKIQNSRNSLLRAGRENESEAERAQIQSVVDALALQIHYLQSQTDIEKVRGAEGMAAQLYFSVFSLALKQQRDLFAFSSRSRRPPRDRVNCLLSFLYALVRHDCVAALTSAGLDPFVGFLHADRPNRPSLALDLMEEFRPWLADRLALTLINRQQIAPGHFVEREGGAVEFTEAGRKLVITAYQQRKQETVNHPLLDQNLRISQLPFIQARILARHLRNDLTAYVPFVPK